MVMTSEEHGNNDGFACFADGFSWCTMVNLMVVMLEVCFVSAVSAGVEMPSVG